MKKKILFIVCSLFLALPVFSFAEAAAETNPAVEAVEQANKKGRGESDIEFLKNKAREEARLRKRAEKKARREATAKKKAQRLQEERERQFRKKAPDPNASAYERANENARFKRSGEVFNNKANKKIRSRRRAEDRAAETVEEKKQEEEAQDDGYGQVDVKF